MITSNISKTLCDPRKLKITFGLVFSLTFFGIMKKIYRVTPRKVTLLGVGAILQVVSLV